MTCTFLLCSFCLLEKMVAGLIVLTSWQKVKMEKRFVFVCQKRRRISVGIILSYCDKFEGCLTVHLPHEISEKPS